MQAPEPTPIWTKTAVYCNCAWEVAERCREQYVSATACGSAWDLIPDDTLSLQTLAMFMVLVADCRASGVDLKKLKQAVE